MDKEYIIKGNAAILKCSVPSFVADFVSVVSWIDDSGEEIVTTDDYSSRKTEKPKTSPKIPTNPFRLFSFDFRGWRMLSLHDNRDKITCERNEYHKSRALFCLLFLFRFKVVNQFYDPEILGKEYVMRGNAAILKCTIPSFVADFVHVEAWIDEEGHEYVSSDAGDKGFSSYNQI